MMKEKSFEVQESEKLLRTEVKGGDICKTRFDEIALLAQHVLKLDKRACKKEKELRAWRDKLRKIKDCEKAKKHMDLTNLFETLLDFVTLEALWKKIARNMNANERELKLISDFHADVIDKVKSRKAKPKSCTSELED